MKKVLLASLLLLTACGSNKTPTQPAPVNKPRIEFRATGQGISVTTPVVVKHTDSVNGLTVYNGALPYQAGFDLDQDSIFLSIDAVATGTSATSTLQVQIFIDGKLFREAFSQGFVLTAATSGTYRR